MTELKPLKPLIYSFILIVIALLLYHGVPIGSDTVKSSSYVGTDTANLYKGRSNTFFVYQIELTSGKVVELVSHNMQGPNLGDKVNMRLSLLSLKIKYYLSR